jgi:hypothetical protein
MLRLSCRPRCIVPVFLLLAVSLVPAFLCRASTDVIPPNEQALADVRAGRIDTARASWWGFDPLDATESLQAALDSRAKVIEVEDMGRPWIVTMIQLPGDKEIVFEKGAVIEAKRGAFRGKNDCLFSARGRKHLKLRGGGATFRMHKADYHKPPYELAEWRHALSLRGCEDVIVEGLTLRESGGDGIYLGVGSDGATNRDVIIRNVVCDGNNRQGISVITAENLVIEDCVFRNTQGTAPQAGIDFEPNRADERLVNCVLRNCHSENNAGHAYHIYLGHMHESSPPISIRFENCTSKGCRRYSAYVGIANRAGLRTVRGSIDYIGCRFEADEGAGVYIRGNEADGCRLRLERCEIVRRDEPRARLSPITIEAPRQLDVDAGNVEVIDCVIRDSIIRQPIALVASPLTRLRDLSGALTYQCPDGRRTHTLDASQLAEWFPDQGLVDRIPRLDFDWRKSEPIAADRPPADDAATFRLRREAALLVWGTQGGTVELTATIEPVGRHTPAQGIMTLTAPTGRSRRLKPLAEGAGDSLTYSFTPQATGAHRLDWRGDGRDTIRPVKCSAPLAFFGESVGVNMIRPVGKLYFPIPAGVGRFAIQVAGAGTAETVRATVRDDEGRLVDRQDNIALPRVFVLRRAGRERTEIWSITFEKASEGVLEDVSVQTLGIPPVFAASASCVLAPR